MILFSHTLLHSDLALRLPFIYREQNKALRLKCKIGDPRPDRWLGSPGIFWSTADTCDETPFYGDKSVFRDVLCLLTDITSLRGDVLLFILAVHLSGLMTAFCSYPSELALCSPQRTHSPAPGLCLWHLWLPWALAWFMSSVYLEPQRERVHCFVDRSTSHPVISQLVWLSEPSWLTLFRSMFPGLPPWNHCSVPSETALEFICSQQFHFHVEAIFKILDQHRVVWSSGRNSGHAALFINE